MVHLVLIFCYTAATLFFIKYISFTLCPTSQLKSLLVGHLYSRCL